MKAVQCPISVNLLDGKADAVFTAGLGDHDHIHVGIPDRTEEAAGNTRHPHHSSTLWQKMAPFCTELQASAVSALWQKHARFGPELQANAAFAFWQKHAMS